ncbi:MAG: sigma 54-interacting transcriptional regulator [Desulfotomaculales bacterium]
MSAQEGQKNSAKQLEVILHSLHEGLIAVDRTGRVTLFNKAAEKILGIPAEKTLGRRVEEVIPNTRLHLVLQTGRPELDQTQKIGSTTILTNRVPVRDEEGNVTGAVAVFRDISEVLNLAEEITALRETRTMLQAIIEATQDAISVVDEQGLGILINPAYTLLTGLSEKDVLGKPATVDIAEGESMHLQVLKTGRAVKNVPMKVGPARREVLVDAAPIMVNNVIKGSVAVIHDVSEIRRLSEELARARRLIRKLEARYTFDDIIGVSASLRQAVAQAKEVAATSATVLLRGESGTGKELFAHAIHQASSRRQGPFIRVNCAAIPDSLFESELFGYAEGAFTGSRRGGRQGYFGEAENGTIFLDEISEINLGTQAKLLRVLQEREFTRVGESRPIPVNVRIIAATNANLERLIAQGKFREDLYYRLNVLPIFIPPLRERPEDICVLADFLLKKLNQEYGRNVSGISAEALSCLKKYHWPGNVRELENVLGRAVINMKRSERTIEAKHLPDLCPAGEGRLPEAAPAPGYTGESLADLHARWERQVLAAALSFTGGNRTKAAHLLKISIRNLYLKLRRHGLTGTEK